ncbi:hypothetical protein K488DRAFT_86468 [Vararia minispora EC-137]|uniref:Uncharacterized protein n=1 Tax=Vararia minispora EC-137 TaxID=1314806 RepID=A0ACB8QIX4_9AGAM|nr:hypothetical protein K488DRAFT_86468 [Vararia minispora EC-137]
MDPLNDPASRPDPSLPLPVRALQTLLRVFPDVFVLVDGVEGHPTTLNSLSRTCRALHDFGWNRVYSRIFPLKFDFGVSDTLCFSVDDAAKADELWRRFKALRVIHRGEADRLKIIDTLYIAHLMLLEDGGLNSTQLEWAGLGDFLQAVLSEQLQLGGYVEAPVDEMCSLVVALLWQWTQLGHDVFNAKKDSRQRERIMSFLETFLFTNFYYDLPEAAHIPSLSLIEQTRAIDASEGITHRRRVKHFGQDLKMQAPPIALYALSLYFAYMELDGLARMSGLVSRAQRVSLPYPITPYTITTDDVDEYNAACRSRATLFRSPARSMTGIHPYVAHWARIAYSASFPAEICQQVSFDLPRVAYRLGDLSGTWEGTYLECAYEHYEHPRGCRRGLGSMPSRRAMSFELEEHYRYNTPLSSVPRGRGDDWDNEANVPRSRPPSPFESPPPFSEHWQKRKRGWCFQPPVTPSAPAPRKVFYQTFHVRPQESSDDLTHLKSSQEPDEIDVNDVSEVILTGTTPDVRRGWGTYEWRGRVRMSDGHIVMVKKPVGLLAFFTQAVIKVG